MRNPIRTAGFGLATAFLLSVSAANAAPISIGDNLYIELGGDACIADTCTDLATAGYNVEGGVVLTESKHNRALKPGSDTGNAGAVSSFNLTSSVDDPSGAIDPITVSGLNSAFGFYWGSVDSFNTVEFFSDGRQINTFTGSDLATLLGTSNSPHYGTDQYVNFFVGESDIGLAAESDFGWNFGFDSVKLSSEGGVAFEVAAASAEVPEPAAIGLMGLGLLSLGLARRRLKKA